MFDNPMKNVRRPSTRPGPAKPAAARTGRRDSRGRPPPPPRDGKGRPPPPPRDSKGPRPQSTPAEESKAQPPAPSPSSPPAPAPRGGGEKAYAPAPTAAAPAPASPNDKKKKSRFAGEKPQQYRPSGRLALPRPSRGRRPHADAARIIEDVSGRGHGRRRGASGGESRRRRVFGVDIPWRRRHGCDVDIP